MQYALFSLSDTSGAIELARFLQEQGFGLLATSSTAAFLAQAGLKVENISDFTGSPEILDGRVKTLHPKVHGSLLYLRQKPEHLEEQVRSGLRDISIVVVNLYPFAQSAASSDDEAVVLENVDIGGPAMLRSAAKNYQNLSVLCQPTDYDAFIAEWRDCGHIPLETRRRFAAKVYSHTAHYDALISSWMNQRCGGELFPEKLVIAGERKQLARYGENPHQAGAIYNMPEYGSGLTTRCLQLHGKEMSYNNFLDLEAALGFLTLFQQQAVIIIKHQNPCGSAIESYSKEGLISIYQRALSCDSISAFGGIVAINREIDLPLAKDLSQTFYEIIVAPSYTSEALQKLQAKKNLRILQTPGETSTADRPVLDLPLFDFRAIGGGFVIQQRDNSLQTGTNNKEFAGFQHVSQVQATEQDLQELSFAWKIASRVKSNAVVFSKGLAAPGIGAGQMSRIDSVRIAAQKMRNMGFSLKDSYMASDAFFPFRDAIDLAANYGVRAIIHPGGSVRDQEVIQAADEHGIIMVTTGVRHFYH